MVTGSLCIERYLNQAILVDTSDGQIVIEPYRIRSGPRVAIRVTAPRHVRIYKAELSQPEPAEAACGEQGD